MIHFCVRWRAGESRRFRTFSGLAADHPAASVDCLFCDTPLRDATPLGPPQEDSEPERVQLIAVGLVEPDEETRAEFERGGQVNVGAVLLHEGCAEAMTDEQLELFVAQLVVEAV